jgi:hypothetical protein
MGTVVLARELALDRPVAIKVLGDDGSNREEKRERFRREARTAAKLSHPNIVPLYTFGEVGGELYFVMGFVEGESLAARLEREHALDPSDLRRIAADLADALDYAHRAGVVHRDVKPENILLDRASGRAMLADFGIAREAMAVTSLTATGMIVGTPHYMSPEQSAGERATDGRSDLYSLGVVAYRALAGRLPFDGGGVREVLTRQVVGEAPPLPQSVVDADRALAAIVDRALNKQPSDRWQTGAELAQALRADVDDESGDDTLVAVDGVLTRVALVCAALTALPFVVAAFGVKSSPGHSILAPFLFIGSVAIGLFGAAAGLLRISTKRPWHEVWSLGLRPPRSWRLWWPKRFRRPSDVWDRLPKLIRAARAEHDVMFYVVIPLQVVGMIGILTPSGLELVRRVMFGLPHWLSPTAVGGAVLLVGLEIWREVRASRKVLASLGLTRAQLDAVSRVPNVDPRWREERFARLLGPKPDGVPAPLRQRGGTAAILALVAELGAHGPVVPEDLLDAVQAASRARSEIDVEIGKLKPEVDADEIVRLDGRLAALDANDSSLRPLLAAQRDILARLESRIGTLVARRTRLDEQLRLLHQQLVELRGHRDGQPDEITGRLRALNDELGRLASAWDDADRIAPTLDTG